jgi:hypothetical protein
MTDRFLINVMTSYSDYIIEGLAHNFNFYKTITICNYFNRILVAAFVLVGLF